MFIAPYVIVACLKEPSVSVKASIVSEIMAVIECESPSRDGILCMQCIFLLLDTLHWWCEDDKAASLRGHKEDQEGVLFEVDWVHLESIVDSIPRVKLASAASKCGAHGRSLLYYETHLRNAKGGGVNIAASCSANFDNDEVSSMIEIYSRLEDPDGLDGAMKLRKGARQLEDQSIAAEKNGSWAEALTLYDLQIEKQKLDNKPGSNGRAKALQKYMNCLLQMGHWDGLVHQVEGLLHQENLDSFERAQLASMATASLWRQGNLSHDIDKYISLSTDELHKFESEEIWEIRIGKLLRSLANANTEIGRRFNEELSLTRCEVMSHFTASSMESYARAYPHLVRLHMIQEISDAAGVCLKYFFFG